MGDKKQKEATMKRVNQVLVIGACVLFVVLMILSGMGSGWLTMFTVVKPGDSVVRLEYARLLAAHHETTDSAIEQYKILIDRNPGNSAAHRELAAAYAWRGDNDRAIYHSRLALRYDSQDKSAKHMRDDLMQGRFQLFHRFCDVEGFHRWFSRREDVNL